MTLRSISRAVRAAFAHDERIAHVLGGLLFMAGGVATIALVLMPGIAGSHDGLALLVGFGGLTYGAVSAFLLPWERMPPAALHLAGLTSLAVVVATSSWTGGAESPIRLMAVFVVVWAACFCRRPEIFAYVGLATATFAAPRALEDGLDRAALAGELVVVLPTFAAIAAAVALLLRSQQREHDRATRVADEHEALGRVATAVADGLAPEQIHALVAREAAIVLGAESGAVIRVEAGMCTIAGAWSSGELFYDVGVQFPLRRTNHLARAMEHGVPVRVRVDGPDASPVAAATPYAAMAVAPIHVPGGTWGALVVAARDAGRLPGESAARLADFAGLVSTAILNAEQRDRLASQAFSDPLTGLANHRAFHERLGGEVRRAQRHGRPLSLVLIDVDSFKSINDSAGHEAGDRVLAEIAARLRDVARGGDLLARIGGDEFGWLLPETSAESALTVVERARDAVAAAPLLDGHSVTISAGVCDLSLAGDADELFRLADGALYWSKAHGRDAARVYDPQTVRELSAAERAEQLARHQALLGIRALARAIDAKDPTTREHSGRVARLACALARARGWTEERVRLMAEAAVVHDVGKIGIADAILLKPGRLTDAEYEEVKRHAALGAQIVEDVLTPEQVEWIRHHHERPDGRGYPDRLTGDELSEGAALMALADAFDVMTAARSYSTAKPAGEALAECRDLVGRQFTSEAVAALEAVQAAPEPLVAA